jgi:nucleoside-triphosphatase
MKSVYLLTGMPGTGKTSLIKQVAADTRIQTGGFYTEEIRVDGIRQGFQITTLNGQTVPLAHVDIRSPHRVSKYGVNIEGLESLGIASLEEAARQSEIVIIDEIGKMELFSEVFKNTVLRIIDSGKKVLGTIMLKSDPWADMIKSKPQVQVLTLTRNNRSQVLEEIQNWVRNQTS